MEQWAKAATTSDSNCHKIDVGRYVAEMEDVLLANAHRASPRQALAILRRWQFDEMLDDASRQRARLLVLRFERWNIEARLTALGRTHSRSS